MVEKATNEQSSQIEVFDWGLYAALIRKKRKDMGYKTAKAFAASVYRRTRVEVSDQTLYKIETGKQIPNAELFFALNLACYGTLFPAREFEMCLSPEWGNINKSKGEISQEWKYENYQDAISDLCTTDKDISDGISNGNYPSEYKVAILLDEESGLFSHVPF